MLIFNFKSNISKILKITAKITANFKYYVKSFSLIVIKFLNLLFRFKFILKSLLLISSFCFLAVIIYPYLPYLYPYLEKLKNFELNSILNLDLNSIISNLKNQINSILNLDLNSVISNLKNQINSILNLDLNSIISKFKNQILGLISLSGFSLLYYNLAGENPGGFTIKCIEEKLQKTKTPEPILKPSYILNSWRGHIENQSTSTVNSDYYLSDTDSNFERNVVRARQHSKPYNERVADRTSEVLADSRASYKETRLAFFQFWNTRLSTDSTVEAKNFLLHAANITDKEYVGVWKHYYLKFHPMTRGPMAQIAQFQKDYPHWRHINRFRY